MKKLILCGFFIFSTLLAAGQDKSEKVSQEFSLDSVVIASTRAGQNTPVAHTTVSRE